MNDDSAKGDGDMPMYTLTAFERDGEKLLDETFEAANDEEAKKIGEQKLRERGCWEKTHRCVNASGKLIL
ncbi:hypothetical protein I6F46_38815, partial [Bradyrhizobium yuanmingense]